MAEASMIRLVRCPKCGNLLPELPDYSVYECGGCGALLRAKKKVFANDGVLENCSKENNVGGDLVSLLARENDGVGVSSNKDSVFVEENVDLVSVSSSRTEKKEFLISNDDVNVGLRLGQEIRYVDNNRQFSKHPIDVQVGGDDEDMNLTRSRSRSVNSSVMKGMGETSAQFENSAKVMRSRLIMDKCGLEREGFWGFDEDPRVAAEHGRFSPPAYTDDGSSNYKSSSFYAHGKSMKNFGYSDGPNGVGSSELNQAELQRKLNDLKEQISRLEEKPREGILGDRKMSPFEACRRPVAYNVSMQQFPRDNYVAKPPNFNHSLGPSHFKNDHNLDMHNFYPPPRLVPQMIPRHNHAAPFRSQMLKRPHNQPPHEFLEQPPPDYFLGHYVDFSQDVLASHTREPFFHQPACSCLHCCNKHWQVPPEVPGAGFSNRRRFAKDPMRSNFYHRANTVEFGPKNHVPIGAIPPPLHSQDPLQHTRWPIDIDSDVDAFYHSRPRRAVVAHGNRRLCHPIGGGAPFMICCNCLELLKLPRKVVAMANNLQKVQCGNCSTSFSFEINNKRLIISVPKETEQMSGEADDVSRDPLNQDIPRSHGCSTAGGTNSFSVDFDSVYNFQSVATKLNLQLEDQVSKLSENEKRQGHISSSSISKEEEQSPDSIIVRDISNSAEVHSKDDVPLAVVGAPFSNPEVSSSGMGRNSKRIDQEKVIYDRIASKQKAEKDVSIETEVEVSFNDYLNTSLSHDSVEISKEDQPRINKGPKTFLVGLIKRSFRDFSRSIQSTENGRPCVLVNGQQIPNHLVKKAEKLAGPIEPGDYWYDFRAGFWGVMGEPCLGIISPQIEEFNHPMPEKCAAGNTGVFVNGRELHQIDLDLLTSRGLPVTGNKKYIIEITGRVLDVDSAEELDCLGKLAPTVEKLKRGFGMRVPKVSF